MKNKESTAPYFTIKRKIAASVICGIFAVAFAVLWLIFPMPFYSIFFAETSVIGSNLLLLILAAVLTFPVNLLFSKITKADIPVPAHLMINAVGMIGCVYLYSIFRYTAVWLLIIGLAVHIAASVILFIKSKAPKIKRTSAEAVPKVKLALYGAVSCIISDCLYVLIFTLLTRIAFSL